MTSRILTALMIALPGTAGAHPGHAVESGGHTHWLALIILGGLGIALAVWSMTRLAKTLRRRWQT